jgi:hypothetical protein
VKIKPDEEDDIQHSLVFVEKSSVEKLQGDIDFCLQALPKIPNRNGKNNSTVTGQRRTDSVWDGSHKLTTGRQLINLRSKLEILLTSNFETDAGIALTQEEQDVVYAGRLAVLNALYP